VIDSSVYENWKHNNKNRKPKFDYILELMEARSIAFLTGVHHKIYYGSQLTIRIINPVTAQFINVLYWIPLTMLYYRLDSSLSDHNST
jgi:hypothetical protein